MKAMRSTTSYQPGEVVLVAFPFTGGPHVKRRPALVILDSGDADVVVARAVRLLSDGAVVAQDGSRLAVDADTMCIHGDTPGAERLAAALRAGLQRAGIAVKAVGAP